MDFYYCERCDKFHTSVSKDFGNGSYRCNICFSNKILTYNNKTFSEMVVIERSLKLKNLLK